MFNRGILAKTSIKVDALFRSKLRGEVSRPGTKAQAWMLCWASMRLVAAMGLGGGKKAGSKAGQAPTTAPGYVNGNRQEVLERTGFASASFAGQVIYRLKCRGCSLEYGSNGCDIHARRCPGCQGGAGGEALRERSVGLFG